MQSKTTVVSIAAAIMIAAYGQKKLHWQLRKVILSGMYNCNFEAINQGLKFARDFFSYRRYNYDLNYKHGNLS